MDILQNVWPKWRLHQIPFSFSLIEPTTKARWLTNSSSPKAYWLKYPQAWVKVGPIFYPQGLIVNNTIIVIPRVSSYTKP
jgi:hypothetical protein